MLIYFFLNCLYMIESLNDFLSIKTQIGRKFNSKNRTKKKNKQKKYY